MVDLSKPVCAKCLKLRGGKEAFLQFFAGDLKGLMHVYAMDGSMEWDGLNPMAAALCQMLREL